MLFTKTQLTTKLRATSTIKCSASCLSRECEALRSSPGCASEGFRNSEAAVSARISGQVALRSELDDTLDIGG